MRKRWLVLPVLLLLLLTVAGTAFMQENENSLEVVQQLEMRHPRRGHQLTLVGAKLWVTGGKAYYSHFIGWGKDGHVEFNGYPDVEVIDLATGTVTYTKIKTGKDFYKATAFTVSDDSPFIYIAGDKAVLKLDTVSSSVGKLADVGEKGDWQEATWGRMTIHGKKYVVIVAEKQLYFFDPAQEKFVKLVGVDVDLPVVKETKGGTAGAVINNRFYVFGGLKMDDSGSTKAWVFDPAAAAGAQWTRVADMPIGIDSPEVEIVDGKAYIVGGASAGTLYKTIFAYDPATNAYERKANMPSEIRNHDTAVVGKDIYISYGYSWGTEEEGKLGFRMHPPHLSGTLRRRTPPSTPPPPWSQSRATR